MGALAGMLIGLLVGIWCVHYFDVSGALNRFCLVASAFMVFQLLGTTIAASLGKPHD
ncbi:MAG: hypothetical protein ISP91_02945 [Pseudomonadales bacterium]|jgi:hypothetical protein|nr:hypothetical protein [Pseudomonadales bacterium]